GLYRAIAGRIPRRATLAEFESVAAELSRLADQILNLLETHVKTSNSSANESQNERHIQNSNPKPQTPNPKLNLTQSPKRRRRRRLRLNLPRQRRRKPSSPSAWSSTPVPTSPTTRGAGSSIGGISSRRPRSSARCWA